MVVDGSAEVCYGAICLLVDPGFTLDRLSCNPPCVSEKEGHAIWCALSGLGRGCGGVEAERNETLPLFALSSDLRSSKRTR